MPDSPGRDHNVALRYKRQRIAEGTAWCDVEGCGWRPPRALIVWSREALTMLHVHHVVPVRHKGVDGPENFVLLCPNHHAIADRVPVDVKRGPRDLLALLMRVEHMTIGEAERLRDTGRTWRRVNE